MSPLRRSAALAATTLLLATTACGADESGSGSTDNASDASGTTTVESAYGEVEVPADPERVAAVSYETPWQLMSLDVQPVATIDYSQFLDSYTQDEQDFIADADTVGTFGEINFEALTAAAPDLIVGDSSEVDEATFDRLTEIAPTVIVGGTDRGSWQDQAEMTAAATGRTELFEQTRADYEAARDRIVEEYGDLIAANTWINFSFGNDTGQFSVQLPTGATGKMLVEELGMAYPETAADLPDPDGAGYASLPLEQISSVFDGVTVALTFAQVDGQIYDGIETIMDSEIFGSTEVATSGQVYGLVSSVRDYASALAWLGEVETTVLEPLSR